jgi:hypothetical protein
MSTSRNIPRLRQPRPPGATKAGCAATLPFPKRPSIAGLPVQNKSGDAARPGEGENGGRSDLARCLCSASRCTRHHIYDVTIAERVRMIGRTTMRSIWHIGRLQRVPDLRRVSYSDGHGLLSSNLREKRTASATSTAVRRPQVCLKPSAHSKQHGQRMAAPSLTTRSSREPARAGTNDHCPATSTTEGERHKPSYRSVTFLDAGRNLRFN